MKNHGAFLVYKTLVLALITILISPCEANDGKRSLHIVYMGSLPQREEYSPTSHHLSILQQVNASNIAPKSLIRSYRRSFNGFAAMLSDEESRNLAQLDGVVSVFPSRTLELHTTRSWDFMGLHENADRNKTVESDVIIGVIDTGVWPESESFNDEGFGPPHKKWKGKCAGGRNFTCNNKLIGARYYENGLESSKSARDEIGHGSHTASTAGGNIVKNVSFYGVASGTARGAVPYARIAVYRVCNPMCSSAALLAAFDDAIADGVDIITISIGTSIPLEFKQDPIAIGSFHAMLRGILTTSSAGNSGSVPGRVTNVSPWMLTVAASSTDRKIIDRVVLGNELDVVGLSVNSFSLKGKKFPLFLGRSIPSECHAGLLDTCHDHCFNSSVNGKILICSNFSLVGNHYSDGLAGIIARDDTFGDISTVVPFPLVAISSTTFDLIKSYVNSSSNPQAEILKSESIKDTSAPWVASFSSRGPNQIVPEIIKPDISAPGVDILAAYSPVSSPSTMFVDQRSVNYNILSGTSISCPHVAGIAAYVKAFHPEWSPAAIKSAIMTTAWLMNTTTTDAVGEFAHGSGHVNPLQTINPGLVYEASKFDYTNMLCHLGYDSSAVSKMSGDNITCPASNDVKLVRNLNYPSLAAKVSAMKPFKLSFNRTVTNVGIANSTYKAKAKPNLKLEIKVEPDVLSFKSLKENLSFVVTIIGGNLTAQTVISSSLVWSDGIHSVRSPIVVSV